MWGRVLGRSRARFGGTVHCGERKRGSVLGLSEDQTHGAQKLDQNLHAGARSRWMGGFRFCHGPLGLFANRTNMVFQNRVCLPCAARWFRLIGEAAHDLVVRRT
jgi:hypothetical protein